MKKHIIKEKVESLTYENIEDISIEDTDKTFFNEKSFTLSTIMLVTDQNDYVYSYALTIKNVKLKENNFSTKAYSNGSWKLGLYSLEIPYQTDIDIVENINNNSTIGMIIVLIRPMPILLIVLSLLI